MQLFYQPDISEQQYFLDSEESRHCIKVLRKSRGELIDITDGKGSFYKARITNPDPRKCEFEIVSKTRSQPRDYYIQVAIAPTKNLDRIEWFIEKSTELGIDEVSFFISRNSERRGLKMERIYKKAITAMKQSVKAELPKFNPPIDFQNLVKSIGPDLERFIAYVDPENRTTLGDLASEKSKYCVMIGPEGDFTDQEIELAKDCGFEVVSLGASRLRTETAGIAACHILNLINS